MTARRLGALDDSSKKRVSRRPRTATAPPEEFLEYSCSVGRIVTNLLSLEVALRVAILDMEGGEGFDLDGVRAGQRVPLQALTSYSGLWPTIKRYNALVTEAHRLDADTLTRLRDSLAHGRVLGSKPGPPFTLYKFGKEDGKSVSVDMVVEMTTEWLTAQQNLVAAAASTVLRRMGRRPLRTKRGGVSE